MKDVFLSLFFSILFFFFLFFFFFLSLSLTLSGSNTFAQIAIKLRSAKNQHSSSEEERNLQTTSDKSQAKFVLLNKPPHYSCSTLTQTLYHLFQTPPPLYLVQHKSQWCRLAKLMKIKHLKERIEQLHTHTSKVLD